MWPIYPKFVIHVAHCEDQMMHLFALLPIFGLQSATTLSASIPARWSLVDDPTALDSNNSIIPPITPHCVDAGAYPLWGDTNALLDYNQCLFALQEFELRYTGIAGVVYNFFSRHFVPRGMPDGFPLPGWVPQGPFRSHTSFD